MKKTAKDIPASVLARLLQHSSKYEENYQSLLIRYVAERFLYRLGQSEYKTSFILKGAYLLRVKLKKHVYRATKVIQQFKQSGPKKRKLALPWDQ